MDKTLTKSAKNAQNYDPCRLFRKGDEVRVQQFRGRCGSSLIPSGNTAIVIDSEDEDCLVVLENPSRFGKPTIVIHSCFLELVTPVEEIQQFFLESDNDHVFGIYFGTSQNYELVSRLSKKYYSLTDAEAECRRLNEEYGKEQN